MKQNKQRNQDVIERIASLIIKMEQAKKSKSDINQETQPMISSATYENSMIQRMEENYKKTKQMIQQKRKQKILQEDRQIKNFKVHNEKSIQINKMKNQKPIYERSQQIIKAKQNKIHSKQMIEEIKKINNVDKSLKSSKSDFNQFYQEIIDRENKKNELLNIKRTQYINSKYQQCKSKPELGSNTIDILKKSPFYQKELLDRFSVYEKKKQINRLSKLKQIKQEQTPFTPKLSRNSQILASKSNQKLNVFDRISRSPSYDCVKRQQLTFREENQFKNSCIFLTPRNINTTRSKQNISKSPLTKRVKKFNQALTNRNQISDTDISTTSRKNTSRRGYKKDTTQQYELKKILQGNRGQLINFVKKLIISERKKQKL